MTKKKILFLSSTRADFGKIKALIKAVETEKALEYYIFVTGMHMFSKYGNTGEEIKKAGFNRAYYYINQKPNSSMDTILANTIHGFGDYIDLHKPDMIIIHGDRVEALAGAIVGALNNIIVGHIEGGERSGTIDESIRHSVSKLSHLHFVANDEARTRLMQMGEEESRIFIIGSPDIDLMISDALPSLQQAKDYYEIPFNEYSMLIYHPVTTNLHNLLFNIRQVIKALISSGLNYIVIYPNNDPGVDIIIEEYEQLRKNLRFRIFPSIRFEYFLVLLRNCNFIIGNSSAGIREAPFYKVPAINIGSRQHLRTSQNCVVNVKADSSDIVEAIEQLDDLEIIQSDYFGDGKSTERFINILNQESLWNMKIQKYFIDRSNI